MSEPITIRYIEEVDLESLLEAERSFNRVTFDDEDFGQGEWLNPWTLSAKDVLAVIRQRASTAQGTHDTRTLVAEVGPRVCGGFAYEIHPEGYEIVFLTIHPQAAGTDLVVAMLDHVKGRARRSGKRKRVTIHLRDRDEAGLRQLLPVLKASGFSAKLARNFFGDHDGWECVWTADEQEVAV